jgi:hypothetical protein
MRYRAFVAILAVLVQTALVLRAQEQAANPGTAWFGLQLPPGLGKVPAVVVGTRGPRPVARTADTAAGGEFDGAAIRADLDRIVAFSYESRDRREVGSGQLWGRITGFPSSTKTVNWAVEQFKGAGINDVRVQPLKQDPKSTFWLPLSWEVQLLGDAAFGAGSNDVVLQSAIPLSPSTLRAGTLTAPLVYVGYASPAVTQHIDVKGKIAVQLVVPQAHMVFERDTAVPRAQELFKRGAVAVFNIMRQPGNEHARDFSNCGGPCFNIGGRDGHFLERALEKAAAAGMSDKLRAQVNLATESRSNLTAENGVGVIKGSKSDDVIILSAHVDGWFDGAGDNADGLAVLVALARHFAQPANRPERTLVFVASAGHHTPGINGPRGFVTANPDLAKNAVLMVNIEHVAQRNFSPSRAVAADGYREAIADSGEAPIVAGITNRSPFLNSLFDEGVVRFGVNFVSDRSAMQSGETGGYGTLQIARITIMQAPPLYHTTGEVPAVISTPGLERMARFLAYFVKEVDAAARTQINP